MSSQGGRFAARKASRAWSPKLQRRTSAKPVVEEFTRQRIGEAEGDEGAGFLESCNGIHLSRSGLLTMGQ